MYSARAKLALARAYVGRNKGDDARMASDLLRDAHSVADRLSLLTVAKQIRDFQSASGMGSTR